MENCDNNENMPQGHSELKRVNIMFNSDDFIDEEIEGHTLTQFEIMAKKMMSVTLDGKVKKLIERKGVIYPPQCALVSVKYSYFLENNIPTDTKLMNIKPYQFRLVFDAHLLPGLDTAVSSMKTKEIAWFLIDPDYTFGYRGPPPGIPPDATLLFYVELLRIVDSGPRLEIPEVRHRYKLAIKMMKNAKAHFFCNRIKLAIHDYKRAMTLLEECVLGNLEEQNIQNKLLIKIYTNLAICYTKDNYPKKAILMCNNVFRLARKTTSQITAKVYFQKGRALIMVGDYQGALNSLLEAKKLEPHNNEVNEELEKVSTKMNEVCKVNRNNNNEASAKQTCSTEDEDDEFKKMMRNVCQSLKESKIYSDIKLPQGLTQSEFDTAKLEAEHAGHVFRQIKDETGRNIYVISTE